MKKFLSILVIFVGILSLVGCNNKTKIDSKLLGTWEYRDEESKSGVLYSFNKDNTGMYILTGVGEDGTEQSITKNITYEIQKNVILVTYENEDTPVAITYKIDGNNLILTEEDNLETILIKK